MTILQHDVHLHLDLIQDNSLFINKINTMKVYTIAVTNLPVLYDKLLKTIHSKYIRVALGFHPELVSEYGKYIPQMWHNLPNARYIGEVGLDLNNKSSSDRNNQITFFSKLIEKCNNFGDKIISVHSRGSNKEAIDIIGNNHNGIIIFHWFTGTQQQLKLAIDNGYYFSIAYPMTTSNKGRKLIEIIPIDKLLIESDSPFVKVNNNIFMPNDLQTIISEIATIKQVDVKELKRMLSNNFLRVIDTRKKPNSIIPTESS